MSEPDLIRVPAKLLQAAGEVICGERWQAPLARKLNIQLRTVQRWAEAARRDEPYPVASSLLEEVLGLLERHTRPARSAYEGLKSFYDGTR